MKSNNTPVFIFLLLTLFSLQSVDAQSLEEERKEMLQLVNNLRTSRGLQPLQLSSELNIAAQQHSEDMESNNFFDHIGSDNSSFAQRIRRTNYDGAPRAENIAAGSASSTNTFGQWENSEGHLRNMLLKDINQMGVGHVTNESTRFRHYWTQVFGIGNNTLSTTNFTTLANQAVQVFPNPAVNEITIALQRSNTTTETFRLTDSTGKVLKIIAINANQLNTTIAIDDIPSGLYFLTANRFSTFKIIKI